MGRKRAPTGEAFQTGPIQGAHTTQWLNPPIRTRRHQAARRADLDPGSVCSAWARAGGQDDREAVQSPPMARHVVLYAGSFDPITNGHLAVLRRARKLFDELVLGLGHNPEKPALFSFEERHDMARQLVNELLAEEPEGAPVTVERYTGLTVDFARSVGATAILRGIRNVTDLAVECQLAITNRQVADIETVFIITDERYAFTSSALIRQVAAMGGSVDRLHAIVPALVIERLKQKMADPQNPLASMARDVVIEE